MTGDERTKRHPARPIGPEPEEVARYLRHHPDFLLRRPDLCEEILPSLAGGDGVVDMRMALLQRAQDCNEELRAEVARLADTARTLQAEQGRVLSATRALMGADNFESLVERVGQDLPALLQVDAVALAVEQRDDTPCDSRRPARMRGLVQLPAGTVQDILGKRDDIRVGPCPHGTPEVFGSATGLIRAEALMRLTVSAKTPPALLGLGARDPDRFSLGRATEAGVRSLLLFLAAGLGELVRTWLLLPR